MKKGESLALLQLTISSGVNKILKYMKYSSKNCNSLESWRLQVSQWKIHLCLTCLQVHLGNSHFWVGDSLFRHVTSWKYNTGQTKQWTTCKRKKWRTCKRKTTCGHNISFLDILLHFRVDLRRNCCDLPQIHLLHTTAGSTGQPG